MSGYLRRLDNRCRLHGGQHLEADRGTVLLPLYTRYLTPADYGAAEVAFSATVVAASIIIRLAWSRPCSASAVLSRV